MVVDRPLPAGFPDEKVQRFSAFRGTGFTDAELVEIGRSLVGSWTPSYTSSAEPNSGLKLSFGNSWERVGLVLSADLGCHR